MESVLVPIHGVGNPDVAGIADDLRAAMGASDSQLLIKPFDWNSSVSKPLKSDRLFSQQTLGDLSRAIDMSSRIRVKPISKTGWASRADGAMSLYEGLVWILWFLLPPALVLYASRTEDERGWMSVVTWTIGALLLTLLFGSLVFTLKAGGRIATFVRSIILIAIRPIIMSACWLVTIGQFPANYAISGPDDFGRGWARVSAYAIGILSIAMFSKFLYQPETRAATAVVVGIILLYALLVFVLAPVSKVLLDVARYLGDSEYRADLQRRFNELIASFGPTQPVILAGHSLGSVIAVHSLTQSGVWSERSDVILITGGSPIKRLVSRFFPSLLFPPECSVASDLIASRLRTFKWINCYRIWDPIGGSLGLNEGTGDKEILRLSWFRVFFWGHTDYWRDSRIVSAIAAEFAKRDKPRVVNRCQVWRSPELELAERPFRRIVQRTLTIVSGVFVATVTLGVSVMGWSMGGNLFERLFVTVFFLVLVGLPLGASATLFLRLVCLSGSSETAFSSATDWSSTANSGAPTE